MLAAIHRLFKVGWLDAYSEPAELRGALGWLGMPGLTAYVGLLDIARAAPGQTVLVSSAAGTVGGLVGQMARIHGCRAVGIAGGAEKCRWATEAMGFEACLDYQALPDLRASLRQACPQGVDIYFDNVGGNILATAISALNDHARVVLCGMASAINAHGQITNIQDLRPLFVKRVSVLPILVSDHWDRFPDFYADVRAWSERGLIAVREEVVDGLAQAPDSLHRLLTGQAYGKLLVRCLPNPLFNTAPAGVT
jgi:NADPH-dependent curcumin reductase CurA